MTKPPCSVEGCEQPTRKRTWCGSHYAQWYRTREEPKPFLWKWGQEEPRPFIPKPGRVTPECSVDGCSNLNDAHGMCTKHVTRWRRHGDPATTLRVREEFQPCKVCGKTDRSIKSRFLCSKRCERLYYTYDGVVPTERACVQCGEVTDLSTDLTRKGRRRRSTARLCAGCRRSGWRNECLSVDELAERDGLLCSICLDVVDLNLTRATGGGACPSIDHIIPRSRGGSNDPDNLALAHLSCNIRKRDKVEVTA